MTQAETLATLRSLAVLHAEFWLARLAVLYGCHSPRARYRLTV